MELLILLIVLLTAILFTLLFSLVYKLQETVKYTRRGLRDLTHLLGYKYEISWDNDEINIRLPYYDSEEIPASRGDVEKFFAERDEKLAAVYKHLGIKVEERKHSGIPARSEIVVTKIK